MNCFASVGEKNQYLAFLNKGTFLNRTPLPPKMSGITTPHLYYIHTMNYLSYPMIFSSSVPCVTRRYTLTTFFWPILCARSMACRSFMGFQSCSTNMTVSAPVRFRPRPPTCVVSSRTSIDGSLLNLPTNRTFDGLLILTGVYLTGVFNS